MSKFYIFDLDGTVIDSSHRQATKPNGDLDLEHWFEKATPDLIMRDSLLPLAKAMKALHDRGHFIMICTARTMQDADFEYLEKKKLPYHACLNRGHYRGDWFASDIFAGGDADLKEKRLSKYFFQAGFTLEDASPIMFEDNEGVMSRLSGLGVTMIDARPINERYR